MIFKSRKLRLFLSFGITTAFLVFLGITMSFRYETNDDIGILFHWAGYITGTPTSHEIMFSTTGLGFAVSRLYMLLPMIPWYTLTHLFMLWLSASLVCFCILDNPLGTKKSSMISLSGAICFLFSLYSYATVVLQFTTTPAMTVGAATVLFLNYRNHGKRNLIFNTVMMTLLLAFSYSMRPSSFYLGGALFFCVAITRFLKKSECRRHFLTMGAASLLAVAVLCGVNYTACNVDEYKKFDEYSKARSTYMDYPRPAFDEAPDVYTDAGLNQTEVALIDGWYFLFDKVNTGTWKKLNQGVSQYYKIKPQQDEEKLTLSERLSSYVEPSFSSAYHAYCYLFMFFCTLVVIIVPDNSKSEKRGKKLYGFLVRNNDAIIALGILIFFYLANIYFAEIGRFPSRVYRTLILVSAPSLLYLATKAFQNTLNQILRLNQSVVINGVAASIVMSNVLAFTAIDLTELNKAKDNYAPYEYICDYSVNNPENVYFGDFAMYSPFDPFVVYPDEKPTNLMLSIGSSIHSPSYMQALKSNGFDEMSQDILLDERVYYITHELQSPLIEYYKDKYPDYGFILVDNPHEKLFVYKLKAY